MFNIDKKSGLTMYNLKYSFMSFSCPQATIDEMLSLASRFGYDGIEPRISAGHSHGVELNTNVAQRRSIRQKIAASGIALSCIATSCRYSAKQQVDETLRCIDLAADLGASIIRVFGGAIPEGTTRGESIEILIAALRNVAGYAADRGITVCVETHDDWCNPAHLAEIIRRVNHSAVAVNWDIMHPVRLAGFNHGRGISNTQTVD